MSTAVIGAPEYRARSGRTVKVGEDGSLSIDHKRGYLSPEVVMDAQEFFQAQRDLERGWWRWPTNPDWVAIEGERQPYGRTVVIVHERTLDRYWLNDRVLEPGGSAETEYQAARAYFEAHPERKPWRDAKPGEVWLVTYRGREAAYTADQSDFNGAHENGQYATFRHTAAAITAARRIWPEDAS